MKMSLFSRTHVLIAASCALITCTQPLYAASFDCGKAKTKVEKALCGNAELSRLDEAVAQSYRRVLSAVPASFEGFVKGSQAEWLRVRDLDAAESDNKDFVKNLQTALRHRQKELDEAIAQRNELRTLSLTRVQLSPADTSDLGEDSAWAKHKFVRDVRKPVYIINAAEVPGAKAFNAMIAKDYAMGKASGAKSSEETYKTLSVNFAGKTLFCLSESSSYYGLGAAHPMNGGREINWLLPQEREMRSTDMFSRGAFGDLIIHRVSAAFKKDQLEPFADQNEVRKIILDPSAWRINAQSLTVAIPPDSIFPHAAGQVEVEIPWSAFRGMVKPEMAQVLRGDH